MCPVAQADGHNAPGLIDKTVPGEAALVEDVGVGYADAVRQPVVAHELPEILDRIKFGAFRGQRQRGHGGWDDERTGVIPSRLIEEQDGVGARRDSGGHLRQVQGHPLGNALPAPSRMRFIKIRRAYNAHTGA